MMEDGPPAFLLVSNWIYLGHEQMQMTGKTKYWPWSEGVLEVWPVGPQQRRGGMSGSRGPGGGWNHILQQVPI